MQIQTCMCVCVCTFMYVHIHACCAVYLHVHINIYVSVYAYTHMYVYTYEYVFSLSSKWKGCRTITPNVKTRTDWKHTCRIQRIVGTMIVVSSMLRALHLPQVLLSSCASFFPLLLSCSLVFVRTRTRAFSLASAPPLPSPFLSLSFSRFLLLAHVLSGCLCSKISYAHVCKYVRVIV